MEPARKRRLFLILAAAVTAGACVLFAGLPGEPARGIDNVIFVVFDTLRADRLSRYGHNEPTTPYLDSHRNAFVLFRQARATSPWTVPSHASMFTGRLPADHKADWGRITLGDEHETLAETLSAQGFCTSALVANEIFKTKKVNLLQGFQTTYFPHPARRQERVLKKLDSELDRLEASSCRRFIFLNFMNNHLPYDPGKHGAAFGVEGEPFLDESTTKWQVSAGKLAFPESEKKRAGRLYDASVRYSDEIIERIVAMLEKRGMLDNTLLIITSDHGDGLGFHQEVGHEISIWEEQLAVPLLVRFPHAAHGGREEAEMVSLAGLHSFILNLAVNGVSYTDAVTDLKKVFRDVVADYRSYFGEKNRRYNRRYAREYPELAERVTHMHALYCGSLKLHSRADGSFALYDIAADPQEQQDVQKTRPEAFEACVSRYRDLRTRRLFTPFDFVHPGEGEHLMGEDDVKALKSLGYF